MPHKFYDEMMKRCREEKYKNDTRYIMGCVLFDILCRRKHTLTHAIANAEPDEQDAMLEGLIDVSKRQNGQLSWIDRRICEAVMLSPACRDVDELKDKLGDVIRKKLSGP